MDCQVPSRRILGALVIGLGLIVQAFIEARNRLGAGGSRCRFHEAPKGGGLTSHQVLQFMIVARMIGPASGKQFGEMMMSFGRNVWLGLFALISTVTSASLPASAQQQQKPNILVIMADDIGYWNISTYNRGQMGYHTPIDRIANEGALFTDYYGQQSCTAGRAALGRAFGEGPDHCRVAQATRLCDRTIWQEPSRRPQRVSADRSRLRRVLWQPLSSECRG